MARSRDGHVLGVLVLVAVIALQVMAGQLPAARPSSAPVTEFSADRAFRQIKAFGNEPRPSGSPAHERVRRQLVRQLSSLGMKVTSPTSVAATTGETAHGTVTSAATTRNIVATMHGTEGRGTVVLLAHYDTVPNSTGSSENGYSVASTVETVRALSEGPRPANDLVVLFSDAEEIGLVGAQAFLESQRLDPATTVVLNQESRGSHGPLQMIRATDDPALATAVGDAPQPMGGSEIPLLFDNHTEFEIFGPAGFRVVEFANSAGSVAYDSGSDVIGAVDRRSLQHRGDTVLSTVRSLGRDDLRHREQRPVSYFALPYAMISYPQVLTVPLAGAAVLLQAGVLLLARRRGVRLRAVLAAFGMAVAALAATGLAVALMWQGLVLLRPDYASFQFGDTPRPIWHGLGMLGLAVTIPAAAYLGPRARLGCDALALGGQSLLTIGSLGLALVVPGAAHLLLWPALVGSVAWPAMMLLGERLAWVGAGPGLAAASAVLMLGPAADISSSGLAAGWFPALAVALMAWPVLAVLDRWLVRRRWVVPIALLVASTLSLAIGLVHDRIDDRHPRHTNLAFVQGEDAGEASWVSADQHPPPWARPYVSRPRAGGDVGNDWIPSDPLLGLDRSLVGRSTQMIDLPPPVITSTGSGRIGAEGFRDIKIKISPRGAYRLAVHLDDPTRIRQATVNGYAVRPPAQPHAKTWFLHYTAPSKGGVELFLRVKGSEQLSVRVLGLHRGLGRAPGYASPPPSVTWAPGVLNNAVGVVARRQV